MNQLSPGSYIFPQREPVLDASSFKLHVSRDKLHAHPDFYLVKSEGSIGIDTIREVSYFLRITPAASLYKILVIDNFHFATIEAQNAFLKTFEEPPEYAYIFLVTPYVDRLLKTIVSRAQIIENTKQIQHSKKFHDSPRANSKIQNLLDMSVGERLLWLEQETKTLKDKALLKQWLIETIDEFLIEGIKLLKAKNISIQAIDYLKELKWKLEQGFPLPKLLLEGFLVLLQ